MGAAGASGEKTYIDNVFSTYVYKGNNGNHTITNGIDNTEGGLLWTKARTVGESHTLFDTVRASNKAIYTNLAERDETRNFNLNFLSSGFSWNTSDGMVNNASHTYAAWNFRKKEGFFDVVTYTGTGSARTIAHSLGCVPGMILIKKTSASDPWNVYHRSLDSSSPENYRIFLDESDARIAANTTIWNQTEPTSTHFSLGTNDQLNGNGATYVAYVFAGGASDEPGAARSVDFDGTGDVLSIADHADLEIGSSTYTMEFWVYKNADTPDNYDVWAAKGSNTNNTREFAIESFTDQRLEWWYSTNGSSWSYFTVANNIPTGQWIHICAQKDSSGYFSFFVNGERTYHSTTGAQTLNTGPDPFCIGGFADPGTTLESNIKVSNFRFIKGTAVYTSSFRPPTAGLTAITNTKLLCCNKNTVTGSTVTPSTISTVGDPQSSTSTPFDDPNGFKFGEGGDQNMIKTGSYFGNGSSTGPEINLGFEPQWVMLKNASSTGNWFMFDMMRGIVTDRNDARLLANSTNAEYTQSDGTYIDLTSTGFKLTSTSSHINGNGNIISYIAIRRPDGLVGKPPEVGTDAFAMDGTANGSNVFPQYTSGFPVDFSLTRNPTAGGTWDSWHTGARLLQGKYQLTATSNAWSAGGNFLYDYNDGIFIGGWTNYMSWMWKRGAGFDVVTYKGDGATSQTLGHSLGRTPEMIWVKRRDTSGEWFVYNKGLDGGTNPATHYLTVNNDDEEADYNAIWNDTAPTSTHFTVGNYSEVNGNNNDFITMLFASVDGISKVGSYTGSGTTNQTITTGFQPRFVIVKCTSHTGGWFTWDTVRGWGSGIDADKYLELNSSSSQSTFAFGEPTSTGFLIDDANNGYNGSGRSYIYYAHA